MKQRIILIASVVVGLIAALLTRQYLSAKDDEVKRKLEQIDRKYQPADVIVVKRDLPSGTILTGEDIGAMPVIEGALRGRTIKPAEYMSLLGRKTTRMIQRGTPVLWSDVEGGEPGSRGLAADVPRELRALSINCSGAASVSGMVRPNDHVDVLGTFTFPSKRVAGEMELVTQTILQNVTVLATGRETSKSQVLSAQPERAGAYSTVTLAVTPREAEMLVFCEQAKGRLTLALRNPSTTEYVDEVPKVDFEQIQSVVRDLNIERQKQLGGARNRRTN
jgi:pilus assembly protein CpaB